LKQSYVELINFIFSFLSVEEKAKIDDYFRGHIERGRKPPTKEEALHCMVECGLGHLHWRKIKEAVWYKSQQTLKKSTKK
jgi:hypothetical protein